MAISAVLELTDPGNMLSAVQGALLNSYTVIDLDYTLKRGWDMTARPSTVAYIDMIKVTIRAPKEFTTPFHNWMTTPDKQMDGVIKIYDSSGALSSTMQGATGGNVPVDFDIANDMASDTVEDLMNFGMDGATDYAAKEGDIYDEMSKEDLMKYIDSKNMAIAIQKDDTTESLRKKIRYYNKIERMSLEELENETKAHNLGDDVKITNDMTTQEKMDAYKRALRKWNDKDGMNKTENTARQGYHKAADRGKKATSQTGASIISAVARSMESARAITFKKAYCVSLREHFSNHPEGDDKMDSSYPWIIELGIKPASIEVLGANFMAMAAPDPAKFTFFNV